MEHGMEINRTTARRTTKNVKNGDSLNSPFVTANESFPKAAE
jgi:hypothetical protein